MPTNYAKRSVQYMNGVLDDERVGEMTFQPSVKGVGGSCGWVATHHERVWFARSYSFCGQF